MYIYIYAGATAAYLCASEHMRTAPRFFSSHFFLIFLSSASLEQVEPQLISVLASTRGLRPDSKGIHWAPVESLVETMWEEDPVKLKASYTCSVRPHTLVAEGLIES